MNAGKKPDGTGPENTVPNWMLERRGVGRTIEIEPDGEGVVHNKPDMVLIEGKDVEEEVRCTVKGRCTVHIVEVGYCWDYKWKEKHDEKQGVYQNLKTALEAAGWSKVVLHSVPLGATGLTGDMQDTWKALGLDRDGADRLRRRIMDVTWESLVGIVKARYAALAEVRQSEADVRTGEQWDVG